MLLRFFVRGEEEGIEASRKDKEKKKAGKHPQITQITQIRADYLRGFFKRKGRKAKRRNSHG